VKASALLPEEVNPRFANMMSAEWCLAEVKQGRQKQERFITDDEKQDFQNACVHTEQECARRTEECQTAE